MFKPNQLVVRLIDGTRFVRRIVRVEPTHYVVSDPMFCGFGSTFAKWSTPKVIKKPYMHDKFTPLDSEWSTKFNNLKKGDKTCEKLEKFYSQTCTL